MIIEWICRVIQLDLERSQLWTVEDFVQESKVSTTNSRLKIRERRFLEDCGVRSPLKGATEEAETKAVSSQDKRPVRR
jgi:hypothetical protein